MFVILGLVFGFLVGFISSLFRAKARQKMLVASNIVGILLVLSLAAAIIITRGMGKSGDMVMALVGLAAVGTIALVGFVIVGLTIGFFLNLVNKQGLLNNGRLIIVDLGLLFLFSQLGQLLIANVAYLETADQRISESITRQKIESIRSQMPPEFRAIPAKEILSKAQQSSGTQIPSEVVQRAKEADVLESGLNNDYWVGRYAIDNERRSSLGWSTNLGWLVAIFAIPIMRNRMGYAESEVH